MLSPCPRLCGEPEPTDAEIQEMIRLMDPVWCLGMSGKDEMMGLFWKRHKVICLIAAPYDITYTLLFPSLRDILGHPWTS